MAVSEFFRGRGAGAKRCSGSSSSRNTRAFNALDQKLKLPEESAKPEASSVGTAVSRDGFALQTAGRAFPLRFGGPRQADGKTFYDPGAATCRRDMVKQDARFGHRRTSAFNEHSRSVL
jgi:hypothetical protein